MANNFIQDGNVVELTNSTGADVLSEQPFVVGSMVVVACVNIANGESGSCGLEGVWALPKESTVVFAEGDKAYLSGIGELNKTNTNPFAGYVVKAAGAGTLEVRVKLARS
jgi:predicted RecA/RadA family phage recombinase